MHTRVGSADSHLIGYPADIDGLRAIAVISVRAFHLSRSVLPGGYLGVDIFFVLSGYLITLILWREAVKGQFSIMRFYERRIRRIMPALLLLLFFATVAAVVLLLPADLIGYGKSVLATLTFVANIYFWRDTDYFSRAAEAKPLLHVWSLGVEEQFFPLLIAVFARFWPRATLPAIAILTPRLTGGQCTGAQDWRRVTCVFPAADPGLELARGLDDLIGRLRGFGKNVVLVGPIAYPGWDMLSELSRSLAFGRPLGKPTYLPAEEFQRQYGAALQHFETRDNIGFARPDKALCDTSRCNYVLEGRSMFADASHIAQAELFRFRSIFAEALATQR